MKKIFLSVVGIVAVLFFIINQMSTSSVNTTTQKVTVGTQKSQAVTPYPSQLQTKTQTVTPQYTTKPQATASTRTS